MSGSQGAFLLIVYGAAFVSVFAIYALLHGHAHRLREQLELSELEAFDVRHSIRESILMASIGVLSIGFAVARLPSVASLIYWLIPAVLTIHGMASGKRKRELKYRITQMEASKPREPEAQDSPSLAEGGRIPSPH